jgi:hypothetical protein
MTSTAAAAAQGPRIEVPLTPARVTRLAKQVAPELRWSSERGARGILVRVWDAPQDGTDRTELHLLNEARRLINARTNLTASVVSLRSRGGRAQFRILVTDEAQEAAQMQEAADKRAAALAAAEQEVAEARAAREELGARVTAARAAFAADEPAAQVATLAELRITEEEPAEDAGDPLTCGTCGRGADSEAHALDHPYIAGDRPAGTAAADLSYRSIRAGAYEVLSGGRVIGRIVRGAAAMSGATWAAYRPGGGLARVSSSRELSALALDLGAAQ